jgi:hypothetical protein
MAVCNSFCSTFLRALLCLQEQTAAAAAWADELPLLEQTAAAQIEAAKQQLAQVAAMFNHLNFPV